MTTTFKRYRTLPGYPERSVEAAQWDGTRDSYKEISCRSTANSNVWTELLPDGRIVFWNRIPSYALPGDYVCCEGVDVMYGLPADRFEPCFEEADE